MLKKRAPKPRQLCEENWGGPCRGGCGKVITGQFTCNDCKKKKAETNFTLNPGEVELWRGVVSTKDKDGEQLMMTRQVVMRKATSIKPCPQECRSAGTHPFGRDHVDRRSTRQREEPADD